MYLALMPNLLCAAGERREVKGERSTKKDFREETIFWRRSSCLPIRRSIMGKRHLLVLCALIRELGLREAGFILEFHWAEGLTSLNL